MKTCSKCTTEKPLEAFSKRARSIDGLNAWCKVCFRAYQASRYKENKETIDARNKAYYKANTEKVQEYAARWNQENKIRRAKSSKANRQANLERYETVEKAWRVANPDKVNATTARYRASKLKRTPAWLTKEDHIEMEDMYLRARYMEIATGVPHHVDHIVPLQGKNVSGLHVPSNLQILTATENTSKGNKYDID